MRRAVFAVALAACSGGRTLPFGRDAGPDGGLGPDCLPRCQGQDDDGDGEAAPPCGRDCDDHDPTRRPGVPDESGDGIDLDCDGVDGTDSDHDGYEPGPGGDCDDSVATIHPGAPDGMGWAVEVAPFQPWAVLVVDSAGRPTIVSGDSRDPSCAAIPDYTLSFSGVAVHELRERVWGSERIDDSCILQGPAAAVRPDGQLSAAYALGSEPADPVWNWGLRLATGATGQWESVDLDVTTPDFALAETGCDFGLLASYTRTAPTIGEVIVRSPLDSGPYSLPVTYAMALGAAVAADGSACVSYFAPDIVHSLGEVRVAIGGQGDAWDVEVIDTPCQGCVVYATAPVFAGGRLHVAYATGLGLTVASRDIPGVWRTVLVDPTPAAWQLHSSPGFRARVSIQHDPEGHLHVAYAVEDETVHNQVLLRYATDRTEQWVIEQVGWPMLPQVEPDVVGYPSLAVDSQGTVHLGWYAPGEVGSPFEGQAPGRYAVLSRPGDGIDQNCDGVDGVDADGDGHASRASGGDDCDDSSAARWQGC